MISNRFQHSHGQCARDKSRDSRGPMARRLHKPAAQRRVTLVYAHRQQCEQSHRRPAFRPTDQCLGHQRSRLGCPLASRTHVMWRRKLRHPRHNMVIRSKRRRHFASSQRRRFHSRSVLRLPSLRHRIDQRLVSQELRRSPRRTPSHQSAMELRI